MRWDRAATGDAITVGAENEEWWASFFPTHQYDFSAHKSKTTSWRKGVLCTAFEPFKTMQLAKAFVTFAVARVAVRRLHEVIDRKSPIDPYSSAGEKLESLKGNIEFRNVRFHYPTREDLPIFKVLLTLLCRATLQNLCSALKTWDFLWSSFGTLSSAAEPAFSWKDVIVSIHSDSCYTWVKLDFSVFIYRL